VVFVVVVFGLEARVSATVPVGGWSDCETGCGRRHLFAASAVCSWGVHGHAFATPLIGVEGGMVLFGLGQGWAQSHKSATPTVGGHADTELAAT
jgi:hypothetical protein